MDFKKQQNEIADYIKDNYDNYLQDYNIDNFELTTEYIDFDKFKNNFIIFLDFDNITFPDRYNDSCSSTQTLIINIFLVFRGDTPANLNDKMMNSTSAFYDMIKNIDIRNAIFTKINNIEFFKYIEGNKNIVSSKITIEVNIEV